MSACLQRTPLALDVSRKPCIRSIDILRNHLRTVNSTQVSPCSFSFQPPRITRTRARVLARAQSDNRETLVESQTPDEKVSSEEDSDAKAARVLAEVVANPLFYFVGGLAAIKLVSSLGEQVGAIVVLSALPVVGLTLISKSDVGKKVAEGLETQLPALEKDAKVLAEKQAAARSAR